MRKQENTAKNVGNDSSPSTRICSFTLHRQALLKLCTLFTDCISVDAGQHGLHKHRGRCPGQCVDSDIEHKYPDRWSGWLLPG